MSKKINFIIKRINVRNFVKKEASRFMGDYFFQKHSKGLMLLGLQIYFLGKGKKAFFSSSIL